MAKIDVNFVPDELCLVVRAPAVPNAGDLYAETRRWANARIRDLLPLPNPTPRPSGLQNDLDMSSLRDTYAPGEELLRELRREGAHQPVPWVVLTPKAGETTALLFYSLFRGNLSGSADDRLRTQLDRTRRLADVLNWALLVETTTGDLGGGRVFEAATPNWLTSASGNGSGGGCPGARPEPAPQGGPGDFEFDGPVGRLLNDHDLGGSALVAILDTSPTREQVVAASGRNPLLTTLAARVASGTLKVNRTAAPAGTAPAERPLLDRDYYRTFLRGYKPHLWDATPDPSPGVVPNEADFEQVDHGLFVAGIVHTIAPDARIELIQVLNDHGRGDLLALAEVIRQLPALRQVREREHLIVNMSLGADVPAGLWHLKYSYRSAFEALTAQPGVNLEADANAGLTELAANGASAQVRALAADALWMTLRSHVGLQRAVRYILDEGALVVAAAGNDYDEHHETSLKAGSIRHEPRHPARYDGVLAVGATGPDAQPASYSNRADVPALDNGVSTFGGAAARAGEGQLPRVVAGAGIRGVMTANRLPFPGSPQNRHGWAYWAGTSFAAPIVSALAARLWALLPTLAGVASPGPADVIAFLRGQCAERLGHGGDPDGVLDAPTIRARQVP